PQLLVVHEDITDRRRMHDEATARSVMIDQADAAIIATDLDGLVTMWSCGAERLYGWTAEQAVGYPLMDLSVPAAHLGGTQPIRHQPWTQGMIQGESFFTRRDGSLVGVHTRRVTLRDGAGEPTGTIGVSVELSGPESTAQHLRAIADSIGDGLCTLDGGGLITHVNPPGQRLLKTSLPEALGGSFMHWVHYTDHVQPGEALAEMARTVECQLVRHDGSEITIEYVATPLPGQHEEVPRGWVVVFREVGARRAHEAALKRQVEAAGWLRRITDALDGDGFVLHAQPIVDIATRQTVQHELLLRLRDLDHPGEFHMPAAFLPIAEAFGVAPAIDRWVLARGLAIAGQGNPVEINLSATSLNDATLPLLIQQLLTETGADPSTIVFEVTETALLENAATARAFADRMHQLGVKLALDDFGTGYGGFTYLKHLQVDFLKIDIEFVRDAVIDPASRHVIDAVVSLAKAFGLQTVAEGVEDEATLALLEELHVDFAQGYLLGRPTSNALVLPTHRAESPP
ncbi:MAG TPA: EAL domain-containing protein, partial [Euzebya sp.]|nr:EAL domain-containing protein [Euzebya sp.]